MPQCFSGKICEALCCGSCNVSNDAARAKFPAGKVLSIRTSWNYLELSVSRADATPVGEIKGINVRRGIISTIIQRS